MMNNKNEKESTGYFLIIIMVFLLYLVCAKYSFLYHQAKVPRGDPFSYTSGFFVLLDKLNNNFWCTFLLIFKGGNWYWLINSLIGILSFLLFKEPYSIVLVNFVLFGFATASIFRLARNLEFNVTVSFLLSLILWLLPSNYGFMHPVSLMQMQLDTAFLAAVIIAVSNTLIYALNIEKTKNAFWAGISIGIAVWGRGNSLPYVFICIGCPLLVIIWKIFKTKSAGQKKRTFSNFIIFFVSMIFMIILFYGANWTALSKYYSVHLNVVSEQPRINFSGILTYIKEIPGRFLRVNKPYIFGTISLHFLVISSLYVTFILSRNKHEYRRDALRIISITGFCIFYSVLLFCLILFNDPNFYALHNYALMLAGLVFCGFSFLGSLMPVVKHSFKIGKLILIILAIILIICYGNYFSAKHTPLDMDLSAATPREVETFSCSLDYLLRGRSLAILWYEMYNPAIINYYRVKSNLPLIQFYSNEFYRDLWLPPYSPKNIENIRLGIRKTFEEADFVIIPEFPDSYFEYEPYPFYHQRDDIASYLNSSDAPEFVVRKILHEPGGLRLVLLQKKKDAIKEGVIDFAHLELPYGDSVSSKKSAYAFVPSDKFDRTTAGLAPIVRVSSQTGTHDYKFAFDGSNTPNSFWEVGGQYPFWMSFEYRNSAKIDKYFLQTGESPERMPTEWQLQGSIDGEEWVTLDKRSSESEWQQNEKRKYIISTPGEYKLYRLYFVAGRHPQILRIYEISLQCAE